MRVNVAKGSGDEAITVSGVESVSLTDTTVASPARMQNYWLGGKDNYAVDRAACHYVAGPGQIMAALALAERAFLARAVRYLARDLGIRQFLDVGTGPPAAGSVHEVAQQAAPESRVVYVDSDAVILAHARARLTGRPEGATAYVKADLRDAGEILAEAGASLDMSRPAAVMMLGVLPFVPDKDNPWAVGARLLAGFPTGSCLAVSHAASDIQADAMAAEAGRFNELAAVSLRLRTRAEFTRFFDGLELTDPGVVPVNHWHPEPGREEEPVAGYAAVGRSPRFGQ
jgi:hypothetical protein